MAKGRVLSGGGSGFALCSGTAADVLSDVTAITSESPLPQAGKLKAQGNAKPSDVAKGVKFHSGNLRNVEVGTLTEYKGVISVAAVSRYNTGLLFQHPEGIYRSNNSNGRADMWASMQSVINALGIASVTSFKAAQWGYKSLLLTWNRPSSGLWSGIRLVGKPGGYPSGPDDGHIVVDTSSTSYFTGAILQGTWYFRAWNYLTTAYGRYYGSYSQTTVYNNALSGSKTITSSQTFTVPDGVTRIQVFVCGGGGGSTNGGSKYSCGGGGGGYTNMNSFTVTPGSNHSVVIGGGGWGADGGTTSFGNLISAAGGKRNSGITGGAGGSGGGSGCSEPSSNDPEVGDGGTDGGNGKHGGHYGSLTGNWFPHAGGAGQGRSTKDFNGKLYSGGGGACFGWTNYTYWGSEGKGGAGGGGYARRYTDENSQRYDRGQYGTDGLGGGGGGDWEGSRGGSGACVIRWGAGI